MVVNKNGNIINDVTGVAFSMAYQGYVAILDSDGAIIQINKNDIYKIYDFIVKQKNVEVQHDLDSFFIEGM